MQLHVVAPVAAFEAGAVWRCGHRGRRQRTEWDCTARSLLQTGCLDGVPTVPRDVGCRRVWLSDAIPADHAGYVLMTMAQRPAPWPRAHLHFACPPSLLRNTHHLHTCLRLAYAGQLARDPRWQRVGSVHCIQEKPSLTSSSSQPCPRHRLAFQKFLLGVKSSLFRSSTWHWTHSDHSQDIGSLWLPLIAVCFAPSMTPNRVALLKSNFLHQPGPCVTMERLHKTDSTQTCWYQSGYGLSIYLLVHDTPHGGVEVDCVLKDKCDAKCSRRRPVTLPNKLPRQFVTASNEW